MKENNFVKKAFTISKLRGIEEVIQTNFRIPNIARKLYCTLGNIQTLRLNKEYTKYDAAIKKLHNKHIGERCFVVGMGPSLNLTDFNLIKDEILFVTNRFFAGNFKVKPQYWCVSDIDVFNNYHDQLLTLDTTLFLAEEAGRLFVEKNMKNTKNLIVIRPMGSVLTWKKFSKDLIHGSYGGNVIFSSLQIAYYMGFKEVYLLGCDCDISNGIHFDSTSPNDEEDNYWNDTFDTYKLCKKVFEKDGRKIYNSTVGGKLEIFERVDLKKLSSVK